MSHISVKNICAELISIYSLFLVTFVSNVSALARLDPLVDTKVGLIRGLAAEDNSYAMFLGIPYALVNGSNPFGPAIPRSEFSTTFEAYDDLAVCPQIFQSVIRGTLDCLHLHVYVPSSASSRNLLPVMIWIHGGSFMHGFSGRWMYDPKFLVKHNVVVVAVNYRVNAYGFMCLNIPSVPGNQGLKDQLLALEWIKRNIEAFGGNPKMMTLFGESAGGHSVDFHLRSSKEKLYDKVILQSGSVHAATVLYQPDKQAPLKMAEFLGFKTDDLQEALDYLTTTNTDSVIDSIINTGIIFKPCVETESSPEPFITTNWLNTKVPKIYGIPVLIGFNKDELMLPHINRDASYYTNLSVSRDYLERIFNVNDSLDDMKSLIHHFYFGDEELNQDLQWNLIEFDSDFTYIHPIKKTLRDYLDSNAGNIYYYMFSYVGQRNWNKNFSNVTNFPGAAHADELGYLFNSEFIMHKQDEKDLLIVERMTKMWTNFAKTSDPTPSTTELLPVKWHPVTKDVYHYLEIDSEMKLLKRPLHKRMAFWDVFYELYKHLQIGYQD